jgi:hypothetical protein
MVKAKQDITTPGAKGQDICFSSNNTLGSLRCSEIFINVLARGRFIFYNFRYKFTDGFCFWSEVQVIGIKYRYLVRTYKRIIICRSLKFKGEGSGFFINITEVLG